MAKNTKNIGYETVAKTRNNGKFASPNHTPLAGTLGVRLPVDLDEWVVVEAKRRGCTKNELIREAVRFFSQHQAS
ncbi:CopG family transcriptional regulator [Okeania sp. SIO1I7]|uniref:ribbon-helix-helix domain-containing protein n=1 Tax=Okeania sp. SIO1I7 TaxID=2607772 RepID=UPI0013FA5BEA|nr:CopG family transcriptional regulator [Okeania sp. SIO1I7]NET30059.1 CopG family transcriptional regulator [Okeania sp. SIO1I7]